MAKPRHWLFKTEPDTFSIDDLARDGRTTWDGVRNYQVRNMLRDEVRVGDDVVVYHSSCAVPQAAGLARVVSGAHPDPSQFDPDSPYHDPGSPPDAPRWLSVDIAYAARFTEPVTLEQMRSTPGLAEMLILRRGNRLSITPLTDAEWNLLRRLGKPA